MGNPVLSAKLKFKMLSATKAYIGPYQKSMMLKAPLLQPSSVFNVLNILETFTKLHIPKQVLGK